MGREDFRMGSRFEKIACTTMSPAVAEEGLSQLEQVLLKRMPLSIHMLNICRIGLKRRFPKDAVVQFYRYVDGDEEDNWPNVEKDPLLVCIQRPNIHAEKGVIIFSPKVVTPEMGNVFNSFIGWDEPQVFCSIPLPFCPTLRELNKLHGNFIDNKEIAGVVLALTNVEKAKAMDLSHDPTISLRRLEQKDLPEIVSFWKWRLSHSEKAIQETIKSLVSCGAYNEDGEMLSSVMQTSLGFFNILYTPEKFRRKGYGQLVMRGCSKWAAQELGTFPAGETETCNKASKGLMESIGYEEIFRTGWFYYDFPTTPPGTLSNTVAAKLRED